MITPWQKRVKQNGFGAEMGKTRFCRRHGTRLPGMLYPACGLVIVRTSDRKNTSKEFRAMAPGNNGKNAVQSCERLIIALDFDSREEALALVKLLGERIGTYKVGYQLFMREGMSFVKELVGLGKKVFLDLKMGDIDRTIAAALRAVPEGVEFVTINGGKATVAAAKEGRGERDRPLILSLTFLSSLDQDDLRALMMNENLELDEYVRVFTRRSVEAGCDGVVASGESIREIRQEFGSGLVIVVPGIRPDGENRNDHKRALTPKMAIDYGADYLVVGRPITEANDSLGIADAIIREANAAFSSRG
ncbi:MAG: orotidine-5'-phosphate decarboxylase [Candidatus Dadabacteria bacterium]|nr:orotidine-5'-phosphate decarboxylase [Candidatus Dadabacteria bacterium]MYA48457.1 orotidine-5'-phosphate decarboxylase [Candidatus Dadabacteria bacterium]MYF48174.1 orotidine-5'-phosphate decarboxylase [Candidatus Dadabacteria bacterium]MYG82969.1 orotidine-5'-phosphate decarboxylase [Candidatus Dadabacteria bacterium]MYK49939.1 orotidine-5'-phosphate decarboxylase [Candidatus Dadabacteria bacterium]